MNSVLKEIFGRDFGDVARDQRTNPAGAATRYVLDLEKLTSAKQPVYMIYQGKHYRVTCEEIQVEPKAKT